MVIRKYVVTLLIGGLFGVPLLFAQTPSDWAGVWRMPLRETPEGAAHWVISEENSKISVQIFDTDWRPQPVTVSKLDGQTLSVVSSTGGYKIEFSVTKQGDLLSGTSKFRHVQYSKENRVQGFRVVKANHWDPLEGIRKIQDPTGWADVSSVLRKAALERNLQKFAAAWDSEIGGPYYLFLNGFWDPDPAKKSKKLQQLHQAMRSKQFAANLTTALTLRTEVVQLVKEKQRPFYFTNPTVLVPSLSSTEVSVIDVLKGKLFVRIELADKVPAASQSRLKWRIAREQIKLGFLARFPLQMNNVPVELIRSGISGYLAGQVLGVSLPALLGADTAKVEHSLARLDTYRKALGSKGNAEIERIALKLGGEPLAQNQIMDLVGYKFGEQMLKRFSADEIAKLDRARLLEFAKDYLQGGS